MTDQNSERRDDSAASAGLSRRGIIRGVAGAGLVATGAGVAVATTGGPAGATTLHPAAGHEPLMARVVDARTGEIHLFVGERVVTIHDREVAARLANGAR